VVGTHGIIAAVALLHQLPRSTLRGVNRRVPLDAHYGYDTPARYTFPALPTAQMTAPEDAAAHTLAPLFAPDWTLLVHERLSGT
jgi:hypothetical protein